MITQSFSWWCFAGRGVEHGALLHKAHEIGYAAVELIEPALFAQALDTGLKIATHGAHQSISSGLNDPAQHDRIEREINAFLPGAQKFGIPSLIVFSGERRQGLSEEEGLVNTITGLQRVVKEAEDAGVTLILELLNSKVDHKAYQADHTAWGVEVCRAIASPNVKLLYDIYHMQIMEGDLIRTIQDYGEYFGHYHTAGNPGRGDIDADDQEISYAHVFRAIKSQGYDGYIGHEFSPAGEPLQALANAFRLTQNALS